MKARTAGTIVAVITLVFILLVSNASANETNENPIIDTVETVKDKAVNNKITQFFINEKNEIVAYQKKNWQQGKDQLAKNKESIANLFTNIKGAFTHYTTTETKQWLTKVVKESILNIDNKETKQ